MGKVTSFEKIFHFFFKNTSLSKLLSDKFERFGTKMSPVVLKRLKNIVFIDSALSLDQIFLFLTNRNGVRVRASRSVGLRSSSRFLKSSALLFRSSSERAPPDSVGYSLWFYLFAHYPTYLIYIK